MQYGEEPLSKTFYCCPIKLNKGKSIWLECWFYGVFSLELSFYNGSVDFQVGQKATGKVLVIVSFLAGCQSRKRLRLVDAVIQQHKPIFWHGPTKHPSSECPI